MRALRFERFGPPSVLTIADVPSPTPGPGEALVRVQASAINRSDVKIVAGMLPGTALPRTPGRDFCGVVLQGRYAGQEVWSSGAGGLGVVRDGAHADLVIVPEAGLSLKPRRLTPAQTAAIGVPFITAWFTLIDTAALDSYETLLVVGAAGAVGRAATQIAGWCGVRVLGAATSATPLHGVDVVIDTTSEDMRERVLEATNGRGVDVVLDTVGGAMFEPSLRSLRAGGRHLAIAASGERRVAFDLADFYHNASTLIGVDTLKLTPEQIGRIADALTAGFDTNALQPPSVRVTAFDDAVHGYNGVGKGEHSETQILALV